MTSTVLLLCPAQRVDAVNDVVDLWAKQGLVANAAVCSIKDLAERGLKSNCTYFASSKRTENSIEDILHHLDAGSRLALAALRLGQQSSDRSSLHHDWRNYLEQERVAADVIRGIWHSDDALTAFTVAVMSGDVPLEAFSSWWHLHLVHDRRAIKLPNTFELLADTDHVAACTSAAFCAGGGWSFSDGRALERGSSDEGLDGSIRDVRLVRPEVRIVVPLDVADRMRAVTSGCLPKKPPWPEPVGVETRVLGSEMKPSEEHVNELAKLCGFVVEEPHFGREIDLNGWRGAHSVLRFSFGRVQGDPHQTLSEWLLRVRNEDSQVMESFRTDDGTGGFITNNADEAHELFDHYMRDIEIAMNAANHLQSEFQSDSWKEFDFGAVVAHLREAKIPELTYGVEHARHKKSHCWSLVRQYCFALVDGSDLPEGMSDFALWGYGAGAARLVWSDPSVVAPAPPPAPSKDKDTEAPAPSKDKDTEAPAPSKDKDTEAPAPSKDKDTEQSFKVDDELAERLGVHSIPPIDASVWARADCVIHGDVDPFRSLDHGERQEDGVVDGVSDRIQEWVDWNSQFSRTPMHQLACRLGDGVADAYRQLAEELNDAPDIDDSEPELLHSVELSHSLKLFRRVQIASFPLIVAAPVIGVVLGLIGWLTSGRGWLLAVTLVLIWLTAAVFVGVSSWKLVDKTRQFAYAASDRWRWAMRVRHYAVELTRLHGVALAFADHQAVIRMMLHEPFPRDEQHPAQSEKRPDVLASSDNIPPEALLVATPSDDDAWLQRIQERLPKSVGGGWLTNAYETMESTWKHQYGELVGDSRTIDPDDDYSAPGAKRPTAAATGEVVAGPRENFRSAVVDNIELRAEARAKIAMEHARIAEDQQLDAIGTVGVSQYPAIEGSAREFLTFEVPRVGRSQTLDTFDPKIAGHIAVDHDRSIVPGRDDCRILKHWGSDRGRTAFVAFRMLVSESFSPEDLRGIAIEPTAKEAIPSDDDDDPT